MLNNNKGIKLQNSVFWSAKFCTCLKPAAGPGPGHCDVQISGGVVPKQPSRPDEVHLIHCALPAPLPGKAPACAEGAEAAPPAIHSTGLPFCQHASSVAGHMVSALFTYYLVYSQSFQNREFFNSLKLPHWSVRVYMQCIFSPFNVFKNFYFVSMVIVGLFLLELWTAFKLWTVTAFALIRPESFQNDCENPS